MKLVWLIGGGVLGALVLAMPACGSDSGDGTTDAGTTAPEGGLADVTTTPPDAAADSGSNDAGRDANIAPPACNDGTVDLGETCDPLSSCPTDCAPVGCQLRTLDNGGTCTAVCDNTAVQTTCLNGDGCCPTGCTSSNDSDCTAVCGNGIVEQGETCDGNCPKTCANVGCEQYEVVLSDPNNACTAACADAKKAITTCSTAADQCCPAGCSITDPDCGLGVCGNGMVDNGETCDPGLNSPMKCPTACAAPNGCNIQTLENPGTCTAECQGSQITACENKDGCCPTGCNASNDNDCTPMCGNGVVEPGEDCDGNCPKSCPQQGCQEYTLTNKGACNITCQKSDLQKNCMSGDQCCPSQCTSATDSDCGISASKCGDGQVEPPETCDGDCQTCPAPKQCFKNAGAPSTCNVVCNAPIEACSGAVRDGCCPFAKTNGATGTCGADTDADCVGKSWQFVSYSTMATAKAGQCVTFLIGNITTNGAYDFTTCTQADAGTKGSGNPRITDATQPRGGVMQTLQTTYSIANENCTDPSSLPLLANWTCANTNNAVTMACASADSGGFTTSGATPITVQVCAGPENDATFPFTVFYNTVAIPTIVLSSGAQGH